MKKRDMRRSDWRRVTKRKYAQTPVNINGYFGVASALVIEDLTAPLTVSYPKGSVKIADRGYTWVQAALQSARFWLTAMFDEKDRLIQLYFDITGGNHFDDPLNPWFEDMYLDIVAAPSGELWTLDGDELDAALAQGDITRRQYGQAKQDCAKLLAYLEAQLPEVISQCENLLSSLKPLAA